MTAYQQVVAAWNAQADELNQWADLGEDEKIEWALKCAEQFRDATKLMQESRQALEALEAAVSAAPLTDSAIQAARTADYDAEDAPESWAFTLGVRFAERAHGITQEQQ